jgi:hypothetical protein|tara:strand:- start:776 stop:1099 length:324 start_codon:yes stop_codon:yes gene_type:complete
MFFLPLVATSPRPIQEPGRKVASPNFPKYDRSAPIRPCVSLERKKERTGLLGDFLPVVLSLGAGLLFAFGTHFLSLGLRYTDAQTGALIEIGTAAAFYWVLMPLFVE